MCKKNRFRTPFDSQHLKQSEKVHQSTFIIFFLTLAKIALEKVRVIDIWNLRAVC